jgi:hypothetical protein
MNQKKWMCVVISYRDFTLKKLIELLVIQLKMNSRYSLLFKLGLSGNRFLMIGPQIGVVVKEKHNLNYYEKIHTIITDRIEHYIISNSALESQLETLSILYKELDSLSELEMKNINLLSLNKEKLNTKIFQKTQTSKIFSSQYLSLTLNTKYYGSLLTSWLKKNI